MKPHKQSGFSLIEVMMAGALLAVLVIAGIHSLQGSLTIFKKSSTTDKLMNALSQRLEVYRLHSYKLFCVTDSGCDNQSREMEYGIPEDLEYFQSICTSVTFADKLLERIQQYPQDLTPIQVENKIITPVLEANGNDLNITFEIPNQVLMKTTIVPQAAGWCA